MLGVHVDVIGVDASAITAAESCAYDLLLLNAGRETSAAAGWCRRLKERFAAPLLVLTPNDNEVEIIMLYGAGADECIVRPAAADVLWAKICAWLRWSPPFSGRADCTGETALWPQTAVDAATVQVLQVEPSP